MDEERFDILIVGGGPAGSAAAITLARAGARVAVVERSQYEGRRLGETLLPQVQVPLARLGVWERFLEQAPLPAPGLVCIWGSEDPYANDSLFNPFGPGWQIDRAGFDRMLASAATAAGAVLFTGARPQDCRQEEQEWRLVIPQQGEARLLRASFLLLTTGRASFLGELGPCRRLVWDRLVGAVRFLKVRAGEALDPRIWIEACEEGWWYSAALPEGGLVAAYMTDADLLPRAARSREAAWHRALLQAPYTAARVAAGYEAEPLRLGSANSYLRVPARGPNWRAAGDAAAAFDPLSAQGIYQALESGIAAAEALLASRTRSGAEGLGPERAFTTYLRERQHYYRQEGRWPHAPFWLRRQADRPAPLV